VEDESVLALLEIPHLVVAEVAPEVEPVGTAYRRLIRS
jgi:hypothetical protein